MQIRLPCTGSMTLAISIGLRAAASVSLKEGQQRALCGIDKLSRHVGQAMRRESSGRTDGRVVRHH
ncbi:hypothetical protein [Bradyrhizobium guangdongense]